LSLNTKKNYSKSPEEKILSKIFPKKISLVEMMYRELNAGNLSKAEELAKKLKNTGKNLDDAYFVLGLINLKKGNFEQAYKKIRIKF